MMNDPRITSLSANEMSHSASSEGAAYNPTPISNRSLLLSGDGFERHAQPKLASLFPSYEVLWKELIWDLTDRDMSEGKGKVRHAASLHLRRFASAHYTFLRSLLFSEALLNTPCLGQGHTLEPFFCNERPLNYYAHMGRIRDMICLMTEEFETEHAGKKPSFRKNGLFWDYNKVGQHLSELPSAPGIQFAVWQSEVGKYRDFMHKTAHAVAIDSNQKWWILKPQLVDQVKDWTEVNQRPQSDFVDLQAQMQRHLAELLGFSAPIWNYFVSEVRGWKANAPAYRNRLSLP